MFDDNFACLSLQTRATDYHDISSSARVTKEENHPLLTASTERFSPHAKTQEFLIPSSHQSNTALEPG
jgi:hypothetical protein